MDLTTIADDVRAWMVAEGIELSEDVGEAEAVIREQVQRIGACVLEQHLNRSRLGYEGSSRACSCGQNQRFVQHRGKTMATLLGPVNFRRAYYHCRSCGASTLPYDERVGLGDGSVSPGLAKAAALMGIHEPFASAARIVSELTGQRLSERTVERLTHQVGQFVAEQETEEAARIRQWDAPPEEVKPERLYVAVDGTMVNRTDGWKEVKTVTCYWDTPDGGREARYAVRWETAQEFAHYAWSLACRCGLKEAKEVVLLGDGARWIWDHVGGVLGDATHIVDWYHAMEHVWTCGRKLHGEGSDEAKVWVRQIEELLWEGRVRDILKRLEEERSHTRSPSRRAALQELITYIRNQDDRLAYARFRERQLDIGSGRVEAACKHVVGARMKRSGMRWSEAGAQATLSLRCAWLNGRWEEVWAERPLAA